MEKSNYRNPTPSRPPGWVEPAWLTKSIAYVQGLKDKGVKLSSTQALFLKVNEKNKDKD